MGRTALKAIQAAAGAGGGDFYPYTVDNSVRFDGSSRMTRTVSAGNRRTWTLSVWVKKVVPVQGTSYDSAILASYSSGNDVAEMLIDSSDYVHWEDYASGYRYFLVPDAKLRDPSAWYHLVFRFDTTQATASDRARIYINGVQQTSFISGGETYPSQNFEGYINYSSYTHYLGEVGAGYRYFNGYMADYNFIDGQSLDPTSFGESKNGVWIPKDASGLTFGTNGFYLDFANSGALGTDSSGNGNNFTVSGLTSSDQMLDTPTLNYATLQAGFSTSATTYSEGNLVAQQDSAAGKHTRASFALPTTGKWYWEVQFIDARSFDPPTTAFGIGVSDDDGIGDYGYTKGAIFGAVPASTTLYAYQDGAYTSGNNITLSNAVVDGDWFGIAYDADTRKMWLWSQRDNAWLASGNPSAGTNPWKTLTALSAGQDYFPILLTQTNDATRWSKFGVNFGQQSFVGTAPTDFLQLNATNLPEPAIGPNSTTTSGENFNSVIYTGTGASQSITGVGFQPDFIWIKRRSASEYHWLVDVLRGVTTGLRLPGYLGETTLSDATTSFDSDGFTAGPGSGYTGASGNTYVAWNWKAGGSGVSNTDGSITSTVSANTDAGFSVVLYTGTGASMTFGHGLGQALDFLILTKRTGDNYIVYPFAATSNLTNYLQMENASAYSSDSVCHTNSSTVIGFNASGARNTNGVNYVAYCFAEVEGFSKFGSYTGNGSTDGPFVYTGFRPAFVVVKKTNAANDWGIWDSARDTYNVSQRTLFADLLNAESNGNYLVDFLSNGFKLKNDVGISNDNGGSYIYMAFAENPFKYANAR